MNTQTQEELSPRMQQAMKVAFGIAEQGDEIDRLKAVIARQNELLSASENENDSLRRTAKLDAQRYAELEERNRVLERDNAVLHSRGDLIVDIWKGDGDRIAGSSDLRPEQIMQPRLAADEQPSERDIAGLLGNMERLLAENRPRESGEHTGGYVGQLDKTISHTADRSGLAEAAAESSEVVKL